MEFAEKRLIGQELQIAKTLLDRLAEVQLSAESDRISWQDGSKDFSVKAMYQFFLEEKRFLEIPIQVRILDFSVLKVWRTPAPSKVAFLVWLVLRQKALTLDKLRERGYHIASRAPFACIKGGSNEHLFYSCSFYKML